MQIPIRTLAIAALVTGGAGWMSPAVAADPSASVHQKNAAAKATPAGRAEGSWITISGIVEEKWGDAFSLDYGENDIRVELDDRDWYRETKNLRPGDEVTVSGRITDDFFEKRSIEASSVYVDRLETHFYGNPTDDDWIDRSMWNDEGDWVSMTGTVHAVEGDDSFVLMSGGQSVTVDVDTMERNPLDDEGLLRLKQGDRVRVTGRMDDADLFEGRQVDAETVILMSLEVAQNQSR